MNTRFILTGIATLAVIIAAWQLSEQKAPQTEVSREVFLTGLLDRVNEVQRLTARSAEHETALVRKEGSWTIENKDHFPAKDGDVRRVLLQLASLRGVEAKTRSAERYGRLGVDDITNEGAKGTRLIGETNASDTAFDLIIGHTRESSGGDQRYVRASDDAQSWLVDGALDAPADPIRWLDAAIVDIDTDRVREVRIETPEETPIHIVKADSSDNYFELQNVPEGFEAKSKTIVSSLGALLLDLRFNDVAAASRVDGLQPVRTLDVRTFDGLVVRGEEYALDDQAWMRFSVSTDPAIVAAAGAVEAEDASDPASTATAATDGDAPTPEAPAESVTEEAARLGRTMAGWIYVLPEYKRRMVTRGFDSLVKEPEPESPPEDE